MCALLCKHNGLIYLMQGQVHGICERWIIKRNFGEYSVQLSFTMEDIELQSDDDSVRNNQPVSDQGQTGASASDDQPNSVWIVQYLDC